MTWWLCVVDEDDVWLWRIWCMECYSTFVWILVDSGWKIGIENFCNKKHKTDLWHLKFCFIPLHYRYSSFSWQLKKSIFVLFWNIFGFWNKLLLFVLKGVRQLSMPGHFEKLLWIYLGAYIKYAQAFFDKPLSPLARHSTHFADPPSMCARKISKWRHHFSYGT